MYFESLVAADDGEVRVDFGVQQTGDVNHRLRSRMISQTFERLEQAPREHSLFFRLTTWRVMLTAIEGEAVWMMLSLL